MICLFLTSFIIKTIKINGKSTGLICDFKFSDWVSLAVLVEVVVDVVEVLGGGTVDVEVPVTNTVELVEHCAVGTEEAVLLTGGETPVPHLQCGKHLEA